MHRRQVLKSIGAGALLAGSGAAFWLTRDHVHPELSTQLMLNKLEGLDVGLLKTENVWGIARTFHHLAQSIEFSMTGYPQMKSELFQRTAGSLAFRVFNARGSMTHGLSEEIPGEVIDSNGTSASDALNRLTQALTSFERFDGALKPHFAYGALSKEQYALAHVMHIRNHFVEIKIDD